MKSVIIIPARLDSSRFPGKILVNKTGKYLIQHVYERCIRSQLSEDVFIATPDSIIKKAVEEFGCKCILTSYNAKNGTECIAEAVSRENIDADIIVNVQGDDPEIVPEYIDRLIVAMINNPDCPMGTLDTEFKFEKEIDNPNIVKSLVNKKGRVIYNSRLPVPYDRNKDGIGKPNFYLRHIGVYAYQKEFLIAYVQLPQGELEKMESLEQLRAIEYGYPLLSVKVEKTCPSIDTPEQYENFVKRYSHYFPDERLI